MKCRLFPVLLLLLTGLLACEEEELKVPTDFYINFGVNPGNIAFTENGQQYQLRIERIQMRINRIEFEGIRESGDNVFFKKEFPSPLQVELLKDSVPEALHYEIPQGIYTHIGIKLGLTGIMEHESFKLVSMLNMPRKHAYQVNFEFNYDETIKLTVSPRKGKEKIVLNKNQDTRCRIDFLPLFIVNLLKDENLAGVEVQQEGDNYLIPITSEENETIYMMIATRFTNAFDAYIS